MATLEFTRVTQRFKTRHGSPQEVLSDINLAVADGEFVSIIGHSGCGKSTLLNLAAGLTSCTDGRILVDGAPVTGPGPERMVVFQNHSLLPWLSVRQNIRMAADRVHRTLSTGDRRALVDEHLAMVGLAEAADRLPRQISGGMQQRAGLARGLITRPDVLLLDEPFGALDALTRGKLQQQLLRIWEANRITVIMVTHDVDEALLLSDRIVMMTNGPSARVADVMPVPFARPRRRLTVVNHPAYYQRRGELLGFLRAAKPRAPAPARPAAPDALRLGFIPLSDCAPLVAAKELGFFEKNGLRVELSRESSWRAVSEGVLDGRLDAAHMLAPTPISHNLDPRRTEGEELAAAMVLSRNGNAVTLSRTLYDEGVTNRDRLREYLRRQPLPPHFAMVFPSSMHNLLLRHWLAAGGIDPDRDLQLLVIPPAQMVYNLEQGHIIGYCVGEPWNTRAVSAGSGVLLATSLSLWDGHPEKVLGMRRAWAESHPQQHQGLICALLEAARFCANPAHRETVIELLCRREYLNTSPTLLQDAFSGRLPHAVDDVRPAPGIQTFCDGPSAALTADEHNWILQALCRWGLAAMPEHPERATAQAFLQPAFQSACRSLNIAANVPRPASTPAPAPLTAYAS